MSTFKEVVYMISDELKLSSDDATYTNDHILFLMDKYRAFLLKKEYLALGKAVPQQDCQVLCLDLTKADAIDGEPCTGGQYLKSTKKLPGILLPSSIGVYPTDWMQMERLVPVSKERMRYVGAGKSFKDFIYCCVGPDMYLYLKSCNPQFLYLETVKVTGVFDSALKSEELSCDTSLCDVMDREFPLEESMVPLLVASVVKELGDVLYNPSDENNDANDQLDEVKVTKQTNETKNAKS